MGDNTEPLLQEDKKRLVTFPIQHVEVWDFYKKHKAVFWTAEEINLTRDLEDWESLSSEEKNFIENILAFFAASDGIVNQNLGERFSLEVKMLEAQYFYQFQMTMENIHAETYSLLIDTYIKDQSKKEKCLNAIEEMECVKKKAEWAFEWIDDKDATFASRLIAFACVEGIFFSGSFCAIFWLKKRGLMPGLCFSNELISRDEGIHCDFACHLYTNHVVNKLSEEKVHEILKWAVDIETEFITKSLPCALIGMNSENMIEYIKFVTDRLSNQLGYNKIWNATNPFPWMIQQGMEIKANFFENRVGAYQKAGVGCTKEEMEFGTDSEF
tara:strand:- start:3314 stop:4294 length:981 start_codon:yes stop_codon:yes gene_type:complete